MTLINKMSDAPTNGTKILLLGYPQGSIPTEPEGKEQWSVAAYLNYEMNEGWYLLNTCYYSVEIENPIGWLPLPPNCICE